MYLLFLQDWTSPGECRTNLASRFMFIESFCLVVAEVVCSSVVLR
jgi:hypothetical protein